MPFPKQKTAPHRQDLHQVLDGLQQKKQGEFPIFMCEFFEGFEVLQTQGHNSKEYIFGIYFANQYCGHIYFGEKFSHKQIADMCTDIMPPNWNQISDYVHKKFGKVSYWKMAPEQYAWIYERVITKKIN